jgi:hypothetical protein
LIGEVTTKEVGRAVADLAADPEHGLTPAEAGAGFAELGALPFGAILLVLASAATCALGLNDWVKVQLSRGLTGLD